jgi:hypothetical protein
MLHALEHAEWALYEQDVLVQLKAPLTVSKSW